MLKMKYNIGQDVMILDNMERSSIVAIDAEAKWYRLANYPEIHFDEFDIAAFPEEVFYSVMEHDSTYPEVIHNTYLFRDHLKASLYMEDLYTNFNDGPNTDEWIKEYKDGCNFHIYNADNHLKCYSCEIKAVKIHY